MENKVKTQHELGAVHLEKKGLDKERFKDLIKGHKVYFIGIDLTLESRTKFIENWSHQEGYIWIDTTQPEPDSKLITLDELEEMLTESKVDQKFILPNNWSVEVTRNNVDTLSEWRGDDGLKIEPVEGRLNSDKIWSGVPKFEIITLEQFKKYVMKTEETKVLKVGDKIELCGIDYEVKGNSYFYLDSDRYINWKCFEFMGTDKRFQFQNRILGYRTSGDFPVCNSRKDLTKFVNAIRDEYQKHMNKMEKTRLILPSEAQSIINIACEGWKPKLAERWAVDMVQGKSIEITEDFYKEMRNACTPSQHKVFDEIFGKDEPECPYEDGELIFVRLGADKPWVLRYATGEMDDQGRAWIYSDQQTKGDKCKLPEHAKAPNVKLPE